MNFDKQEPLSEACRSILHLLDDPALTDMELESLVARIRFLRLQQGRRQGAQLQAEFHRLIAERTMEANKAFEQGRKAGRILGMFL